MTEGFARALCSGGVLFLVASLVRLLYLFARGPDHFSAVDTPMYDAIAASLLAGQGFALDGEPTAFRAPAYPLFLALVYWLFGVQNHLAAQLLQIALSASVALLLVEVGRELGDERIGWVAGWLTALHVNLIFWAPYVLEEALLVPALVLAFYLVLRTRRRDSAGSLALAGLSAGALLLTRPASLPFVAAVPLWFAWTRSRTGRSVGRPLAVLMLSTVLVLVPWTIRNYVVFGRFVPVCSCGGGVLWYGTQWDEVNRAGKGVFDPTAGLALDEFQRREAYLAAFVAYVKTDPVRYASLAVRKAVSFWSLYFPQYSVRHRLVKIAFFGPLFALSALGLCAGRLDRDAALLVWALLASTTVLHMATVVDYDGRYRVALEAILSATAAAGSVTLMDYRRRDRERGVGQG